MPPARKRTTANRCCYQENGRRCQKPGQGNPPLCQVHRLVMEEAARPRSAVVDVLKDIFNNRRPDSGRVVDAMGEVLAGVFTAAAASEVRRNAATGRGQEPFRPFSPFSPFSPFTPFTPPRAAPPPPPPHRDELEIRKARATLGFRAGDKLTVDLVKERKRKLARKNHPDLGGSTEKMAAINAAADLLVDHLTPAAARSSVG